MSIEHEPSSRLHSRGVQCRVLLERQNQLRVRLSRIAFVRFRKIMVYSLKLLKLSNIPLLHEVIDVQGT